MSARRGLAAVSVAMSVALMGAAKDWRGHVPARERERVNPLAVDPAATEAGAKLYAHDCAVCHAGDANGKGSKPGLRTDRMRETTDGELFWLLRNGSLGAGMPAWSKLPEGERWQLVRYLRTLTPEEVKEAAKE